MPEPSEGAEQATPGRRPRRRRSTGTGDRSTRCRSGSQKWSPRGSGAARRELGGGGAPATSPSSPARRLPARRRRCRWRGRAARRRARRAGTASTPSGISPAGRSSPAPTTSALDHAGDDRRSGRAIAYSSPRPCPGAARRAARARRRARRRPSRRPRRPRRGRRGGAAAVPRRRGAGRARFSSTRSAARRATACQLTGRPSASRSASSRDSVNSPAGCISPSRYSKALCSCAAATAAPPGGCRRPAAAPRSAGRAQPLDVRPDAERPTGRAGP
jgi:hypothetical protein